MNLVLFISKCISNEVIAILSIQDVLIGILKMTSHIHNISGTDGIGNIIITLITRHINFCLSISPIWQDTNLAIVFLPHFSKALVFFVESPIIKKTFIFLKTSYDKF